MPTNAILWAVFLGTILLDDSTGARSRMSKCRMLIELSALVWIDPAGPWLMVDGRSRSLPIPRATPSGPSFQSGSRLALSRISLLWRAPAPAFREGNFNK
jgi:hypothetical protein